MLPWVLAKIAGAPQSLWRRAVPSDALAQGQRSGMGADEAADDGNDGCLHRIHAAAREESLIHILDSLQIILMRGYSQRLYGFGGFWQDSLMQPSIISIKHLASETPCCESVRTMEGLWSLLRLHRGISQEKLPQRLQNPYSASQKTC
jgi:hypothetical protein